MNTPLVSILMVARNAAEFIDEALRSARCQTVADIEIVVVDDGSSDATFERASAHASEDRRVRVMEGPRRGLSAVRNLSLDAARGRFAVVLDSDDVLAPDHVAGLLAAQQADDCALCAANMIEFDSQDPAGTQRLFAQGDPWREPRRITAEQFVQGGMIGGRAVSPGYLKPLLDMAFLRAKGLRYDERLRIGEDFDLVLRILMAGGTYRFLPRATYYYRKHAASTSHRLARTDIEGLLRATLDYRSGEHGPGQALLDARRANLEAALRHHDAIAALKARQPVKALRLVALDRQARSLACATLHEAATKRAGRLMRRPRRAPASTSLPSSTDPLAPLPQPSRRSDAPLDLPVSE